MIGAADLLAMPRPLPLVDAQGVPRLIERFMRALPGRRPKMPTTSARLRYPSRAACEALLPWLNEVLESRGETVASAVLSTLSDPVRAYPVDGEGSQRFVLVSAFEDGRFVECTVHAPDDRVTVDLGHWEILDEAGVAHSLEALMPRVHAAARHGDRQRAGRRNLLVVADAGRMGSIAGGGWMDEMRFVCEPRGHDLEFDTCPIVDGRKSLQTMDLFDGTALVVVTEAAGPLRVSRNRHPRWRHFAVELDTASRTALLEELRMMLDLGLVDPPMVTTWKEFADRADELEGTYLALTDHCKNGLLGNDYFSPSRMWTFAAKLSEAARRRRAAGWNVDGRIATWITETVGIEVALTDSNLPSTEFLFQERELSWEPHVKVDDAKDDLTRCGRIYFAIDDDGGRLVVNHIGVHL